MADVKSWGEFKDSGLLWFVNKSLHLFGWAIVVEVNEKNEVINGFPARVKFRGFTEEINTDGYIRLSEYLKNNSEVLHEESKL